MERANFTAASEGPTANEIELKSQLEELNEQLINARAELKLVQDKLILSTSKNTILEKDLQDSRDTLETLQKVLERISDPSVQ
jgi:septal ring factor EnvC (AmiA/AmiB activator)